MNNPELEKEYGLAAPLCEQFGQEIIRQLEELFLEEKITLGFPIQYRVKSLDSALLKIERAGLQIKSIHELNDLIGIRIILLFKRDVEAVRSLIKKYLNVFDEEDARSRLAEDEFGYASVHFQAGLRSSWKKMPTFRKTGNLRFEIQVRTVAQHIWAAASHILQYKQQVNIPPPVRRSIYRASALLETVDLEFERVLNEKKLYSSKVDTNASDEELNVDSLAKVLEEILPAKNKTGGEEYTSLLKDLFYFSVRTPQQLRTILDKHLKAALQRDAEQLAQHAKQIPNSERIKRGAFFNLAGLTRGAMRCEFEKAWEKYQREEAEKFFATENLTLPTK